MMITPEVQMSKGVPSFTALRMPSGIDTAYWMMSSHRPSEIDTGIFSTIRLTTLRSRK